MTRTIESSKYRQDKRYGNRREASQKSKIEKCVGSELTCMRKYSVYDFINDEDKVVCELKSRRCDKNMYPTTMIGYNKILKGYDYIKYDYKVYLFFKYRDGLYYIELTEDFDDKYSIREGGRYDRGCDEVKKYMYIKVCDLVKVE